MAAYVDIALISLAVATLVPACVFLVECLAACLLPRRLHRVDTSARPPRVVILVPAHNEAGGITSTLSALMANLNPGQSVLVVADNCDDDTASRARAAGATVVERHDDEHRGKGYAIVHGLDALEADPPDVVVVLDADCTISRQSLDILPRLAHQRQRPVQAEYVLRAPDDRNAVAAISGLAVLVKNRVRPTGLRNLGLPTQLTGSGMAFPWRILRDAPHMRSNLVEDMVIGLELALAGTPPISCGQALVQSQLPQRSHAARSQRRRWEHGHLTTLIGYGPRLLARGIARASLPLIALALDLAVPPLALLVLTTLAMSAVGAGWWILGGSATPVVITSSGLASICIAVLLSWARFGRSEFGVRELLQVPLYVAWKVPVYLTYFVRRGQKTWVRTERDAT